MAAAAVTPAFICISLLLLPPEDQLHSQPKPSQNSEHSSPQSGDPFALPLHRASALNCSNSFSKTSFIFCHNSSLCSMPWCGGNNAE